MWSVPRRCRLLSTLCLTCAAVTRVTQGGSRRYMARSAYPATMDASTTRSRGTTPLVRSHEPMQRSVAPCVASSGITG